MRVVNILKDGTVIEDMSKTTVPVETVKRVCTIVDKGGRRNEKKNKGYDH